MRPYPPASWGDISGAGSFRGPPHRWARGVLAPKRAGSPGVLPGWHDGMTEAVVGFSEAVNGSGPRYAPFLSKTLVGVDALVPFGCLPGVTLALWRVFTASFIAGWSPLVAGAPLGVVKSPSRVPSVVAWSNPCTPVLFAVVARPAPLVAGAAPSGAFVTSAA